MIVRDDEKLSNAAVCRELDLKNTKRNEKS